VEDVDPILLAYESQEVSLRIEVRYLVDALDNLVLGNFEYLQGRSGLHLRVFGGVAHVLVCEVVEVQEGLRRDALIYLGERSHVDPLSSDAVGQQVRLREEEEAHYRLIFRPWR